MGVTVFTTAACGGCVATKSHLKRRGVEFEEIRIDQNPEWADRLRTAGYLTAPVVLVGDEDVWGGFSSDSLEEWWPKAS